MSFYNSKFDLDFKKEFSSSYASFTDDEIYRMAQKILFELTNFGSDIYKNPNILSATRKTFQNIIDQAFSVDQGYNESYTRYLKSYKLLTLFNTSSELLRFSNKKASKRFVYSRLRSSAYNQEIQRYAEYEKIPLEFASLSIDKDCIKKLVGFFLKKHLKSFFSTEILESCKIYSSRWLSNTNLLTPYDRTGELQKYLYSVSNEFNKSELEIPSKLMRLILSTARLHFTIMDESNLNPNDLLQVLKKQREAADLEEAVGYSYFHRNDNISRLQNKKYIKNWRKRHLMPFLRESDVLVYIAELSDTDPFFSVKLALLDSRLVAVSDLLSLDKSEDKGTAVSNIQEDKETAVTSKPGVIVDTEDQNLWNALRSCRRRLAEEYRVPPYVIFHDNTLREMLAYRPTTKSQLLTITGVGHGKFERFGNEFLKVIREAENID